MTSKWGWPSNKDVLKNKEDFKNDDKLKNEEVLKNGDNHKNEDNLLTLRIKKNSVWRQPQK